MEGVLRPDKPLALRPGERVHLILVRRPDASRWDVDRLAESGKGEDLRLAEQGLADWAVALEEEDRR
ncbi:MAG: hypothetical protein ACRD2T_13990 [Thermoanaerobaculia bacterium]